MFHKLINTVFKFEFVTLKHLPAWVRLAVSGGEVEVLAWQASIIAAVMPN